MSDLGRRAFLTRMWQWGLGLIAVAGAWTSWDILKPGSVAGFGGKIKTVPTSEVPEQGVLAVNEARTYLTQSDGEVIALYWKCPHLSCRAAWCESSGQYECPCHGSVFNRVGEYRSGPAPRNMDRFPVELVDGFIVIDTGTVLTGGPPARETIDEPPLGSSCEEGGA
jgi:cytochrome b6-f complex iron-sulfur subunit